MSGLGITGKIGTKTYFLGNSKLMNKNKIDITVYEMYIKIYAKKVTCFILIRRQVLGNYQWHISCQS